MSDEQALFIIYKSLLSSDMETMTKMKGTHPYFERYWELWALVKSEYPEVNTNNKYISDVQVKRFLAFDRLKTESKQIKT